MFTTLLEAGRKNGGTFVPPHQIGEKNDECSLQTEGGIFVKEDIKILLTLAEIDLVYLQIFEDKIAQAEFVLVYNLKCRRVTSQNSCNF